MTTTRRPFLPALGAIAALALAGLAAAPASAIEAYGGPDPTAELSLEPGTAASAEPGMEVTSEGAEESAAEETSPKAPADIAATSETGREPTDGPDEANHEPAGDSAAERNDETIAVTSGENAGPGTLREAVEQSNYDRQPWRVISVDVPEVTLTDPVEITSSVEIRGAGAEHTRIFFVPREPDYEYTMLKARDAGVRLDSITLASEDIAIGLSLQGPHTPDAPSTISNSVIEGFGYMGVYSWGSSSALTVTGTTFRDNGTAVEAESMRNAPITLVDSHFVGSSSTALSVISYIPDRSSGVRIERSTFAENGSNKNGGEWWYPPTAGAVEIGGEFALAGGDGSPVSIIDSNFLGNVGYQSGAIALNPWFSQSETAVAHPHVLVSGSTFVDNYALADENAYDPSAAAIQYPLSPTRSGDDEQPELGTGLRIENSTFDHLAAATRGLSQAIVAGSPDGVSIELDHVTATDATLPPFSGYWASPLSVSRSVIDSGGVDPFGSAVDEESQSQPVTVSDSIFTSASDRVALGEGSTQVIDASALGLGELGPNGGATDTRLPAADSPLVDAVTTAGSLAVDQRGLPRPAGAAADIGAVELQPDAVAGSTIALGPDASVGNGKTATFTVTRTADDTGNANGTRNATDSAAALPAVSVEIATIPGTAAAGVDFVAAQATLEWAAGDTSPQTFSVETLPREAPQPEREFTVRLSSPSADVTLGRDSAIATLEALVEESPGGGIDPDTDTGTELINDPDPEPLSETGANGGLIWLAAAALLVAGAGAWAVARARRHASLPRGPGQLDGDA